MERLHAQDEVEGLIRKREELVRDDIGDAVGVVLDIEADAACARREQVVVRPRATPHVEDVHDRVRQRRDRLREPCNERAEMEVVELRDRRSTTRAADRAEVVG